MKILFSISVVICLISLTNCHLQIDSYYIDSIKGNDKNPGTYLKPIKTIEELNLRLKKKPGNVIFTGGQVFKGTLILNGIKGADLKPFKICSSGSARAVIHGGNSEAIKIENCEYILVSNLDLVGNGRKNGSTANGLSFTNNRKCKVENIGSKGFQKSGVDLYNCIDTEVENVIASDNGFCGINVMGSSRYLSRKIMVRNCKAENNPGDPSNLDNHSGNGILVGVSDSVLIDHSSATNNGWDMPRLGNGPVGIWTWESDHVTIQYCISYRNKTARNAKDGGGFDLDGGVTNSVIQYCLSYENQGAGYGLFQYSGASNWSHNTVRYCVSINDGQTTEGSGSIFIWNGANDENQLKDCFVYNNVIFNSSAPLISFEAASSHKNFRFCNNIFLGTALPISGKNGGSSFTGNDWWNPSGILMFMNCADLEAWARKTGQEMLKAQFVGIQEDPKFLGPLVTDITDPWQLHKIIGFTLSENSPLRKKGLDIKSVFGEEQPAKDFFGNTVSQDSSVAPGICGIK